MNLEKKGIICGAIWGLIGLISLQYAITRMFESILAEYTIYLPTKIVSFFGILIFGESPRKLLILVMPFYIIGTIFMGAFLGYLITKIILKIKQNFLLNKDLQ